MFQNIQWSKLNWVRMKILVMKASTVISSRCLLVAFTRKTLISIKKHLNSDEWWLMGWWHIIENQVWDVRHISCGQFLHLHDKRYREWMKSSSIFTIVCFLQFLNKTMPVRCLRWVVSVKNWRKIIVKCYCFVWWLSSFDY